MAMDNAMHRCQPDAGARLVRHRVQPLKRTEQFVDVRHVEPGPVVTHKIHRRLVVDHRTNLNHRLLPFACEFPCVAERILEHDSLQL